MYKKMIFVFTLLTGLLLFSNIQAQSDYTTLEKQLKTSKILHNEKGNLPDFSLVDHNSELFNNENFKNKWTLLAFIYTHCPDVCPTVLMNMSMLKPILANKDIKPELKFVAITFDPERDTPEVLKTYITHFDKSFLGVSGEQAQIDRLVKLFGAYYERSFLVNGKEAFVSMGKEMPDKISDYSINHTAEIYLISPDGKIFAKFPSSHNVFEIANDIGLMVEQF